MLHRDVRAANKTCLFTSETSDRAEPITPWIYFPIPISQLLGMTAIKGRAIDFLSQPAFTVDKTKPITVHLFIYLSLEGTQSATPDVFVQLCGISRRDQSPPSSLSPSLASISRKNAAFWLYWHLWPCLLSPCWDSQGVPWLARAQSPPSSTSQLSIPQSCLQFQTCNISNKGGEINLSTKPAWWVQMSTQVAEKSGIKIFLCFSTW